MNDKRSNLILVKSAHQDSVLVVDDEAGVRKVVSRILTKMGFAVTEAESGISAKEAVSRGDFCLIVSDIAMPGMDGIQLLRAVREHDYDVPVILITGKPSFETAVEAIEYGAFHYFTKPFSHQDFRNVVSRAVRMGRIARVKRSAQELLGGTAGAGDLAGLDASLSRAMDLIWLAFQPIVRSSDQTVYGHEALMRCDEPSLAHANAVLEAAERLDRLEDVGRLIRARAAAETGDKPESGVLFLNLHPRDLLDDDLTRADSPLVRMADRVVLELTERASLENLEDVRGRVKALRELGFRVAVDDLGAGYAGLTSLATLQPEIVKIDMSLIRGVDKEPIKRHLVKSITATCREMDVLVVAEGVETVDERDTLVEIGCDLLQGFRFARPGKPFPGVTW